MLGSAPSSLDDLICPQQERLGDAETERSSRLQLDEQLELGRLLEGKICGLGALQDSVHKGRNPPKPVRELGPAGEDDRKGEGAETHYESHGFTPRSHPLVDLSMPL